jgi:8-oxo-dGTP pyrophosphatase MutT (NUDIX family)
VPVPKKSEHGGFPIREDHIHKIEVHVAGICVRESEEGWQVLAAKRDTSRSLFPNKWECGGGMVHSGEGFHAALKRQMFEEFGIAVDPWFIVEAYEIHVPHSQKIIPGVRFTCLAHQGKINLNKREFSTHRWLTLPLQEPLDWIDGIERAINQITPRILGEDRPEPKSTEQDDGELH